MRREYILQASLFDQAIKTLIAVIPPEKELKIMHDIICSNPDLITLVHNDLGNKTGGRKGITAERVLRCAILKQYKGYSYRELVIRLNDSGTFRWFSRFNTDFIPHYTTLQKLIKSIKPNTWSKINDILIKYAKRERIENGKSLRADTTVTGTNISYPVDARLINDSVRVLNRLMLQAKEFVNFAYSDRTRRVKKRCYQIVMAKGRNVKQRRKKLYQDLLKAAKEVKVMVKGCMEALFIDNSAPDLYAKIEHYLVLSEKAINQCYLRVIKNKKVSARQKIVSIFEPHTDIIMRGKSGSPVEFGHKVLICSGKSGIITHFESYRGNPCDGDMLGNILTKHSSHYKKAPYHFCADRRFFSAANEELAYRSGVKRVSICKPGYQSKKRKEIEKSRWFKGLQRFRAGIEGLISALMRSYGLKRCLWKGWEAFKSYIGLSVVTFNLKKIAQLL